MQCTYLTILIIFRLTVYYALTASKFPSNAQKGQPSITEGLMKNVASMRVPTSKAVARSWVHSENSAHGLSVCHSLSPTYEDPNYRSKGFLGTNFRWQKKRGGV